jgi:uncharacterized protein YndB with AHSA1/START domain
MKAAPVIQEVVINASAAEVWKAITDKNEMKHWYFDLDEFEPKVGFEFQFSGGSEEKQYLHLCKITEVIEGKKLAYNWRYDGYPGNSLVTFELFEEGKQTRLKLIHEGLETFPQDNPDFAKESFTAGWTEIIGTLLKQYLEKRFTNP